MILPEWETALRLHLRRRARVNWAMYDDLIQQCLELLRHQTHDVQELRAHYARGAFWALQVARKAYPNEPPLKWDPHLFTDAAYGYRYRELTGEAPTTTGTAEDNEDDDNDS